MQRFLIPFLMAVCTIATDSSAQQPVRKDSRSFSVQCRLQRSFIQNDAKGRPVLENTTTTLPDIITVENARTEYVTERKSDDGIYQFRIGVQILKISEGKVRLDLQLEDTWSDGPLDKPLIHRHALQTSRTAALGAKLRIALQEKNDKDEGIWVELTVKELMDDE